MAHTEQLTTDADFAERWEAWHREHEAALASPEGFLAITAIHWLDDQPLRVADLPGSWTAAPHGVTVALDPSESLSIDGTVHSGAVVTLEIEERASLWGRSDSAVVEIARRGGRYLLRPRDAGAVLRTSFHGTPAYAPDPTYVVAGTFVAFTEPHPTTVGSVVEGLVHVYDAPGVIDFELHGQPLSLTAFRGADGELTVLFTDATSGTTTYAANRALRVGAPDSDGRVVIDFNRATNLPCAYTDLATCPLPPAGNHLPVRVDAGEQIPYGRGGPHPVDGGADRG